MKIEYIKVGDYYIPNLAVPEEHRPIGLWGQLHKRYLEEHHTAMYQSMILSCTLWTYLADLNEQAEQRYDLIVEQMKAAEGVTEEMKATNQMVWVQHMNNIANRAREIILHEMIYCDLLERSE